MITCLDIENTFSKKDSSPYSGKNQLVSVGYKTDTGDKDYLCFFHSDRPPYTQQLWAVAGCTVQHNAADWSQHQVRSSVAPVLWLCL